MAEFTQQLTSRYYPPLLYEELTGVTGIADAQLTGYDPIAAGALGNRDIIYRRLEQGLARIITTQADLDPAVVAAVQAVIVIHVADPGPGPVGLTKAEINAAWSEIGFKIARDDPTLENFRQTWPEFNADLEYVLDNWGTMERGAMRNLGRMLYHTSRYSGMPAPVGYDPFNEASLVINSDGSYTWVPL